MKNLLAIVLVALSTSFAMAEATKTGVGANCEKCCKGKSCKECCGDNCASCKNCK